MDRQLSGSAARERLIPLLEEALGAALDARTRQAVAHLFELGYARSEAEREHDRRVLERLAARVNGSPGAECPEGTSSRSGQHDPGCSR